jgi:hypothetical protein
VAALGVHAVRAAIIGLIVMPALSNAHRPREVSIAAAMPPRELSPAKPFAVQSQAQYMEYPMANNGRTGSGTIPLVPLLITESDEEFNRIREALYEEIKPLGIIECMYVDEIADLVWQILRLKRCKAGVINLAFHKSSANILGRLMNAGPDVARDWISDPKIAEQVEERLATYKLDGSVIIADAIKEKSFDLEPIDALLVSLETRRDRALVRIAQYRGELGAVLRRASDHLIESKVVQLPDASAKKKARRRQLASGKVVELDGPGTTKKDSAA